MTERRAVILPAALAAAGLVLTLGAGGQFAPSPARPDIQGWYAGLAKPGFTPDGQVVAGVWVVLDAALAYGGFRLLRRPRTPPRDAALALWALNSVAIAGWSYLFFGLRAIGASALASAAMLIAAAVYGRSAAKVDRTAAWSAAPLVGWLSFATIVAEEVWRLNR